MNIQSLLLCEEYTVNEKGQSQLVGPGIDLIACAGFPCVLKIAMFVRLVREDCDPLGQLPFNISLLGPSTQYSPTVVAACRIICARGENLFYNLELPLANSGLYRLEGSSPLSNDEPFFLFVAEQAEDHVLRSEDQGYQDED